MRAAPAADPGVVVDLRAAARSAQARGAPATACALLSRALDEPPREQERAELLFDLARAEAAMGRTGIAATHLREAHERARDPVLRGQAILALVDAVGGDMREVFALEPLVLRTRAEVAPRDPELAWRLCCAESICGDPRTVLARQAAVLDLPCDTAGEALALGILVVPMVFQGKSGDEVERAVSRVFRQAERIVEEGPMSLVTTALHLGLFWLDRLDDDLSVLDAAVATAQRRGSTADLAIAYATRAVVHRRAGRLGEAEADARTALAAGGESGWAGGGEGAIIPLAGTLIDRDRLDEADSLLDDREIPDTPHMNFLLLERMRLRGAQGRRDEALGDWTEYVRRSERIFGIDSVVLAPAMCDVADLHQANGEREAAVALVERALGHARTWGRPGHLGPALAARARLEDRDAAVETLREAVALLRSSPARLELARALVALGGVMRRRGERSASREPLREGHALARQCSADGLADMARAELRASGVRVHSEVPDGVDGLTASERRVAELAAAGASNADIAHTLFLTVKTVEMHLTRSYRKLDIGGRAELARALESGTGSPPWRDHP
jgi:DNA-binding CsgD family transcriptional regulator/tetratricopeptide (TPR) repeat protein